MLFWSKTKTSPTSVPSVSRLPCAPRSHSNPREQRITILRRLLEFSLPGSAHPELAEEPEKPDNRARNRSQQVPICKMWSARLSNMTNSIIVKLKTISQRRGGLKAQPSPIEDSWQVPRRMISRAKSLLLIVEFFETEFHVRSLLRVENKQ